MITSIRNVASTLLLLSLAQLAHAQPSYDAELAATSPQPEALSVGLAGENPASIGRYLLARGAEYAQLSPVGKTVAFRYSVTGQPQLWTAQPGQQPRQITFGNGITFFRWMPDGENLIYGADNEGDELEAYYLIQADGSAERLVLPASAGSFRIFGDVSNDGHSIAYASTQRNGLDFDIYTTDLRSGRSTLIREGHYAQIARSLSPDGKKLIISEVVGEDANNLYLLDMSSGKSTTLFKPSPRAATSRRGLFEWTSDSKGFYAATNAGREFSALVYFDTDSTRYEVLHAPERDVQNVSLCGDDRYLVWTTNEDGYFMLFAHDLHTKKLLETPDLPEGVYSISCNRRTSELAVLTNGWQTPGDIHLWDLESGDVRHVFSSNLAGLDAKRLVRPQSIRMSARDGVELQGLLYLPSAESSIVDKAPPVLFEVHGGPVAQSMAVFDPVAQYHADSGLSVFKPNVRGSSGFGRTYMTLDDRERRLDSVRDLVDMLDFLAEDGRVDTTRSGVSGQSYGGYMVNAVLAGYPGKFKVGVARYGVADWVTALQVASPMLKAADLIEYGDISQPKWQAFYKEHSPIRQADLISVPVLYSHGINDPRVNISETETMVKALRSNGIQAPYIRFPDEGHGWRKLSNRLFYFRQQAQFLETALLNETE